MNTLSVLSDAEWGGMLAKWKTIRGRGAEEGENNASPAADVAVSVSGGRDWAGETPGPTKTMIWAGKMAGVAAIEIGVLLIVAAGISSVLRAGGGLCSHSARVRSSHRRCLLNVRWGMVGLAVMSSEGAGVSAAACTASTCCNVAIPNLPLTTTIIDKFYASSSGGGGVCNQGASVNLIVYRNVPRTVFG